MVLYLQVKRDLPIPRELLMDAWTMKTSDSFFFFLHCNSSFTLQWKLICIFFASENLWDFFFNSDIKSQKLYSSSSVHSVPCNFFFHLELLLALLWVHQFFIRVLKMLINSVQQYSQLPETCTCQSLFHEFLEDETLL